MVKESVFNEYGDGVAWFRGSLIGRGGFGRVYTAKLKNPNSKYSCYPPLMAVKSAEVSSSASIQKEREVFNNVKGCPYVIQCFGDETTNGANGLMVYNLLLEYGSAGTLADRIVASGEKGLDEFEVKMFARSILRGLRHIHNLGYVHCDLKPENILLFDDRRGAFRFRAKIGDLGLAKRGKEKNHSKKRKLEEPSWRGTPLYISPEALTYGEQESPCDIWAFGCTVLEMLTGKPSWNEKQHVNFEDVLEQIVEKNLLPEIPGCVSKVAKEFLKGCFVRTHKFRWTADMLLCHPFLSDLPEEDEVDEGNNVDEIGSIVFVYDSEVNCSSSYSFYDDEDDSSVSYWSDFSDDGECGIEEGGEALGSSIEKGLITSNEESSPPCPGIENEGKFSVNLAVAAAIC